MKKHVSMLWLSRSWCSLMTSLLASKRCPPRLRRKRHGPYRRGRRKFTDRSVTFRLLALKAAKSR
jgi:hypothetical protein